MLLFLALPASLTLSASPLLFVYSLATGALFFTHCVIGFILFWGFGIAIVSFFAADLCSVDSSMSFPSWVLPEACSDYPSGSCPSVTPRAFCFILMLVFSLALYILISFLVVLPEQLTRLWTPWEQGHFLCRSRLLPQCLGQCCILCQCYIIVSVLHNCVSH